ncbi:MAG: helix-turn-helix domain-containing protein [Treponema sp.]|jgi:transcriptional regulator with XRE-family HTH domain|nr:helix-turn-helix domain-containing protein [Treponema sp.]
MEGLREIFAHNLRKNRRKCGLSQEKLAELVEVSTHHIAMIETAKSFPAADLLERLADVLNIEIHELFLASHASESELERLRRTLVIDVRQTVDEAVGKAFEKQNILTNIERVIGEAVGKAPCRYQRRCVRDDGGV